MKHRLAIIGIFLAFVLSVGTGLFPHTLGTASAADTYAYNNAQFDAIQGPNPYSTAGESETATWRKTTKIGQGVYIAVDAPFSSNSGGYCYPAIQTSSKKYDGAKAGSMYLNCGSVDKNNPEGSRKNIAIETSDKNPLQEPAQKACQGKTGQELQGCIAGYNGNANGKTEDESCKGFSGNALQACKEQWQGQKSLAANGEASPNCENQGGPLGWMLCGIFDMMSDGAQWIFANLLEPFLVTPPISTNPEDPSFQIWSNLRVYGNIFLIIALLVIVFGEAIGGGLIDAYTAKKVLPRLLVAAILINLSIYIVAFLVDFTNVLGKGVGILLTEPLTNCQGPSGGNCWEFTPTTGDQARVFGVGLIGLLAGGTAVAGFLGAIIFGGLAGVTGILTVAFFVLLPMFLAVLAVFITLIIRKGLILMLVLVSPIAFALYCLPNTEKYFRKWWELLIQALMVYPIIVAIFGVAEILSVTILAANNISPSDLQQSTGSNFVAGNLNRTLSLVVAFLLQFLPLLAVPFAFRMAGGAMGRLYEFATSAGQRANQLADNRREHAKRDYQSRALSARGRMYHGALAAGATDTSRLGLRRRASQFAARRAGGYNVEGLLSAARAEKMKILEDQIATGRDEEIRGLTVNKGAALASGRGVIKKSDGTYRDVRDSSLVDASQLSQYEYQQDENSGARSFQSLGGAWVSEQDVDAGHRRWGRDQFAQQGALSYEMRKALNDDQRARIETNYADLATEKPANGGWGMSKDEAYGSWIGSAFANQNSSLQYKYMNKDLTGGPHFDYGGLVSEVYEKRGSYDMSRMDATTINRLEQAWESHETTPNQREQLKAIAQTMDQRMRSSNEMRPADGDGDEAGLQATGMGPGHVNNAMASFVSKALKKDDSGS